MKHTHKIYLLVLSVLFISCTSNSNLEVINTIEDGRSKLLLSRISNHLDVPWDMQYDSINNYIVFSEIAGKIKTLNLNTYKTTTIAELPDVYQLRTLGLLGMALYQGKENQHYLFLSYTSKKDSLIHSNLVRYNYDGQRITNPKTLLQIPGNTGHNGSRIIITKDNKVLWATGDAANDNFAQDTTSLNGKILRLNLDGSIPKDNPIPNSYVYAWGFRNIQGLTQSKIGKIYSSEHGDAIEDEINIINPLNNYGWPQIEGKHDTDKERSIAKNAPRTEPIYSWTPVIAPSGMTYYNSDAIPEWKNSLLLTTLKTQSLRILKLNNSGNEIIDEKILFANYLGRLRSVLALPNGDIYFSSSNKDWNPQPGFPKEYDDAIYKISKSKKVEGPIIRPESASKKNNINLSGQKLYESYCSSCHKSNGEGIPNSFPSLKQSPLVLGDINTLTSLILQGTANKTTNKKYEGAMPSFAFLTNEELASITNYIRTSFGNNASKATQNTIQTNRLKNEN